MTHTIKKRVAHVKFSNCAWAPDELVKCLNKYSDNYESVLLCQIDKKYGDPESYSDIPRYTFYPETFFDLIKTLNIDVFHFHNRHISTGFPDVLQYHSPPDPDIVDFVWAKRKLVVGQYHATLKEYSDCIPFPNIIELDNPVYMKGKNSNGNIRIGFSPSVKTTIEESKLTSKGYYVTEAILNKIREKNPGVETDLIHEVGIQECLERKSKCDILIDECVTKSYHRSGLEGLALGKLTICSLGDDVIDIVKKMMKTDNVPFENIWIDNLEEYLQSIINKGKQYIQDVGEKNRQWMIDYWSPKQIIQKLENIYQDIII